METFPSFPDMWRGVVSRVAELERQALGAGKALVDADAVTGSLRTLGTGALQAAPGNDARIVGAASHAGLTTEAHGGIVAGNDGRLSNARTPTAHAATHALGGTDSIPVEAWHVVGSAGQPAFQNGWTTNVVAPAFYKDPLGIVRLKGGVAPVSGNTPAFTLPVGYRPADQSIYMCPVGGGSTGNSVTVNNDGTVVPVAAARLDVITFRAA